MTQEEVREQVIGKIARKLLLIMKRMSPLKAATFTAYKEQARREILSIPEILIKDPDQSLPRNPWDYKEAIDFPNSNVGQKRLVVKDYQEDVLKEHWVKVIKGEK